MSALARMARPVANENARSFPDQTAGVGMNRRFSREPARRALRRDSGTV
jgi:hypothetical protein